MIKFLEEYNQSSHDYAHCAGTHHERASQCLYYTANIMLDVNVKMLFTLFSKFLIYYTKFENSLLSFLTFAVEAFSSVC